MPVGPNDVNVISIKSNDLDFSAGQPITLKVEAEAGTAIHATGGQFRMRMTLTDTTTPSKLNQQDVVANYGGAAWPNPGLNVFTFTVPAAATAGKDGDLVEPQARLISNAAAPFDADYVVGEEILLTP
jgi:hypothetical protein